jgi:RNA polymerase sigma-70 factor (ECF subfamily)
MGPVNLAGHALRGQSRRAPWRHAATTPVRNRPRSGSVECPRTFEDVARTIAAVELTELTDQDVIARARQGSERAYRELIRRYERPVFSLIYRIVRDREKAEDLAQDTFIKVLNAIDRYKPEYKFSSWIFKIAHNTALDDVRRKEIPTLSLDGSPHIANAEEAAAHAPVVASDDPSPEDSVEHGWMGQEIEAAIATLRDEYRTAIVLRHIEDLPYEEIAEIMAVPLGTVKTYIHRARKELREQLEHLRC